MATAVVTAAMLRTWLVRFDGHRVHVIGQIFPGAGDAAHFRLAAEFSFGTDFAGHAGHFRGESRQLIHHGVDGVFEFQNFAFDIDRDFLREVAVGHGGGHFGDVADLVGQVARHEVHVVGEIFPRSGDAFHLGLAAEFSFGADFAGHAGDFRGEGRQLVHHRVDDFGGSEEFAFERAAFDFERHGLREIALRHGADDARHFGGRLNQVADQSVDRIDTFRPGAGRQGKGSPLFDAAFFTNDVRHAIELLRHPLVHVDDFVHRVVQFAGESGLLCRQPGREITFSEI